MSRNPGQKIVLPAEGVQGNGIAVSPPAPVTFSSPTPPPPLRPWVRTVAIALLALHFVLAVGSKLLSSTTSDELAHLTAGVSFWQNRDYRLHPENGILPEYWAALPAWADHAKFPPLKDNVNWQVSDVWMVGYQFFYETGEDHFPRLMAGRAMIALFSVATGWLVFCWSRRLFGDAGALVSLTFYAFCPTFLAHGALVTSDMCMAFFFLAAAGAWWRHLHDGRARIWWLSAITLGLAFVAKHSSVLLLPMMVIMALVRALAPEPMHLGGRNFTTRVGKFGAAAASAAAHGLVVAAVIWTFYGFRFSAFNPALPPADHFIRSWSFIMDANSASGRVIGTALQWRLLPEGYLYGFAYVLKTVAMRGAFLNGEYSITGWFTYFPWTFLLKTTPATIVGCGFAGWIAWRRWAAGAPWRRDLYRVTPLIVLFTLYWATSLTSHLNIGHRHLLPTYPVLFIALGALGAWITSAHWPRIALVAVLVGSHVFSSARIAPFYLAYFNFIGGGPEQGWRHLVDSSLDWGQDLPTLRTWLEKNAKGEQAYLSYSGTSEPDYYAIRATRMPFLNLFRRPNPWYEPRGGVYCISATILQHVYSPLQGEWRLSWEREYQRERTKEHLFREYWSNSEIRRELYLAGRTVEFEATWARYDQLRFARLCSYLRVRGPDASAGHSILIFRLTDEEVAAAIGGNLSTLAGLMEHAEKTRP